MVVKAALLLFRDNQGTKELLFARPKGKAYFVFPGGKLEAGETIAAALQRELQEELGTPAAKVKKLGVVTGHTPDRRDLEMHLYTGELRGNPRPQAEIEAIIWLSKESVANKSEAMTPMTLENVLPFLTANHIW